MEEKRKHKRLDLDVTVELERLDKDGVTTFNEVQGKNDFCKFTRLSSYSLQCSLSS